MLSVSKTIHPLDLQVLAAIEKQDKQYVVTLTIPSGSRHDSGDMHVIW